MEPSAAQGSAWASATALGAEMLSQGRLKPDRKSALKTVPKIKKLRFYRFTLPHYSQKHFDLESSVAIITERWLMQTHFPLRLGH